MSKDGYQSPDSTAIKMFLSTPNASAYCRLDKLSPNGNMLINNYRKMAYLSLLVLG
jgi:hypothetical protein